MTVLSCSSSRSTRTGMCSILPYVLYFFSFLSLLKESAGVCPLCLDASPITKPDVVLGLTQPVPIQNCQDLVNILQLIDEDSDLCLKSRSLSTFCGCPKTTALEATVCHICNTTNNETITRPQQGLDGFVDFGENQPDTFGLDLTCALFESAINVHTEDAAECSRLPFAELQNYCGCDDGNKSSTIPTEQNGTCSFCPRGEIVPLVSSQDDMIVTIQGTHLKCSFVQGVGSLTDYDSELCPEIQSISTACGCPASENSCALCGADEKILETGRLITVSDENGAHEVITCSTLDARLHTTEANSERCLSPVLEQYRSECRCINVEEPYTPCTLCVNGEKSPVPEKEIVGIDGIGFDYIEHSCGVLETAIKSNHEDTSICTSAQIAGPLCGCTSRRKDPCRICGPGETMKKPHALYMWTLGSVAEFGDKFSVEDRFDIDREWTCELADSFLALNFDNGDEMCYHTQLFRRHGCGCEVNADAEALSWTQRVSGSLSLLGSSLIILSIARKKKKERWSTYNVLITCVSTFDCCSSIAYIFGTALTPKDVGIYGGIGNKATCGFQAFLFQLGLASIYYNFTLSVYFVLIVKYRWNSKKLSKIQWWFHGITGGITLIMAFAIIPFATPDWRWCYLSSPPLADTWWHVIIFFILPVGISLLGITVMTVQLVLFVHATYMRSKGRKLNSSRGQQSVSDRVFRQSLGVLGAFYVVWPIQFASIVIPVKEENYWVFFLAALLGPLQGFLNAVVLLGRDRTSCARKTLLQMKAQGEKLSTYLASTASGPGTKSHTNPVDSGSSRECVSRKKCSVEEPWSDRGNTKCDLFPEEKVRESAVGPDRIDPWDEEGDLSAMQEESLKDAFECLKDESDGILEHALTSGLLCENEIQVLHESSLLDT